MVGTAGKPVCVRRASKDRESGREDRALALGRLAFSNFAESEHLSLQRYTGARNGLAGLALFPNCERGEARDPHSKYSTAPGNPPADQRRRNEPIIVVASNLLNRSRRLDSPPRP